MNSVIPVSVFIITKNEEARIGAAIGAVRAWADEMIVLDCGSTDRTCEIARELGASVHYAERLCRNRWLLNVDADEVVMPALAAEIRRLFAEGDPEPAAYRVRILTIYPGDDRPRPLANDYNVVRLYHADIGSYRDHPVFDRIETGNHKPRQLGELIFHHAHKSVTHAVEKALAFSEFRASASNARPRGALILRLAVEFPLAFLKAYIGRRHFTGGWKGFYFSMAQAFMRTTRIARMIEARNGDL